MITLWYYEIHDEVRKNDKVHKSFIKTVSAYFKNIYLFVQFLRFRYNTVAGEYSDIMKTTF